MGRQIDVGSVDDFNDGSMKAAGVEGRELLVVRVGDRILAADERCPHMGGHLSRGVLEGTVVRCPRHGSRFDLADGSVVRWLQSEGAAAKLAKLIKPPRPLRTYPVEVREGRVLIEM